METVIIKNITNNRISIEDLGISINSQSYRDIGDLFLLYQLKCSKDLLNEVNVGNIILNDGTKDLSHAQALSFFGIS